jgi:hypothetical protein
MCLSLQKANRLFALINANPRKLRGTTGSFGVIGRGASESARGLAQSKTCRSHWERHYRRGIPIFTGWLPCKDEIERLLSDLLAIKSMRPIPMAILLIAFVFVPAIFSQSVSTIYGTSYQVNVDDTGHNIVGDAANEPSLCVDPTNPDHIAVGWRQFSNAKDGFRQAGWSYSTNGGVNWTFPGVLDTNLFRSDPVLAADPDGRFYYLGVLTNGPNGGHYFCDLWQSTNGGKDWQPLGLALGGDKEWMAVDTTAGPGRGFVYQTWSPFFNFTNNDPNKIFTRSTDGGQSWMAPVGMPRSPYFGTMDIGPNGEVYTFGADELSTSFVLNRSTNAPNASSIASFDLTTVVDLGGSLIVNDPVVNPQGLSGQPWVAADRSPGVNRGNVYVLCSVSSTTAAADVMFARSTDGGRTFSKPLRINDDSAAVQAFHWFGTLAVAPNGRIDVCWNDTRGNPSNTFSELYYSFSQDGGLTWSTNRAVSAPFNHTLGYPGTPPQEKMGDYIGMVSLNDSACIAYTATFNGEEDIYFLRLEAPIVLSVTRAGSSIQLSWNSLVGRTYCVQAIPGLDTPWSAAAIVGCITATNTVSTLVDPLNGASGNRFYKVVEQQ